ncbi:MAG: chemotaxis response regulator protein-glutamate methylesterase [Fretibacterium sp.]|nr:chemotaxis response regulator protein-glutamate methylesterase [Fretibacterium sp.]
MNTSKIKVLIVDDSALMRTMLEDILSADPRILVVGTARDGQDCLEKMERLSPDVITLDVEMPRKDGLETLEEIMRTRPLPVIMVSSLTQEGAQTTLKALALGCIDFVGKPSGAISRNIRLVGEELIAKVVMASTARVRPPRRDGLPPVALRPPMRSTSLVSGFRPRREIVAVAASTGGPVALQQLLAALPGDFPAPIVVTQHMPKDFTASFARRLDGTSALKVVEGASGLRLKPGMAVIAPGGAHMLVRRKGTGVFCELSDAPPLLSVKPSANIMFLSVADEFGGKVVGVVLTGMGRDGADGALALHRKGAHIIAESQETCVIYGMPRAAVEAGGVDELLPLPDIPASLVREVFGK